METGRQQWRNGSQLDVTVSTQGSIMRAAKASLGPAPPQRRVGLGLLAEAEQWFLGLGTICWISVQWSQPGQNERERLVEKAIHKVGRAIDRV